MGECWSMTGIGLLPFIRYHYILSLLYSFLSSSLSFSLATIAATLFFIIIYSLPCCILYSQLFLSRPTESKSYLYLFYVLLLITFVIVVLTYLRKVSINTQSFLSRPTKILTYLRNYTRFLYSTHDYLRSRMIEEGSHCIKYKRLHGKSMTCGSKRKKNVLIVLPFYSDRVTESHGTEHVTDTTTRQMDTQSTRGGVLSMSSRFFYVLYLIFF